MTKSGGLKMFMQRLFFLLVSSHSPQGPSLSKTPERSLGIGHGAKMCKGPHDLDSASQKSDSRAEGVDVEEVGMNMHGPLKINCAAFHRYAKLVTRHWRHPPKTMLGFWRLVLTPSSMAQILRQDSSGQLAAIDRRRGGELAWESPIRRFLTGIPNFRLANNCSR